MAEELAYVLINPYTIIKSRTGGVVARLLERSSANLIAVRMFAPSRDLVKEYLNALEFKTETEHPEVQKLIRDYIAENYMPAKNSGSSRRVMLLLFKGENVVEKLHNQVVGHITRGTTAGETIRDTYGDYIRGVDGKLKYFEPAVIMGANSVSIKKELAVWIKYLKNDSGILRDVVQYQPGQNIEETLVIIKPDCFQWPSGRPGSIIDMFSKTGLYIIAAKIIRMSIHQAEEFYGPVKLVLAKKFGSKAAAEEQFNKIIEFMTGLDPMAAVSPADRFAHGKVKCLALVYQGVNAVSKIRTVLGTTDPSKAAPATVRKEFGKDVMINTAHASDSVANAKREIGILKLERNDFKDIADAFYNR